MSKPPPKPIYDTYDYQAVDTFTPLSETNWYRVARITNVSVKDYEIELDVQAVSIDGEGEPLACKMIIEVTSYEKDSLRVRFDPRAKEFSHYKDKVFGPIIKRQLDWIKQQEQKTGLIDQDNYPNQIKIILRQVEVTIWRDPFWITVKRISDGTLLHKDGWCKKQESDIPYITQGIIFVDPEIGSAVAALKYKPQDARYYGCGESYEWRPVSGTPYHTSDLEHTGQMVTFFNYDILGYDIDGRGKPELVSQSKGVSNNETYRTEYYYPMYFAAPFAIEHNPNYALAIFLDNVSQTYFNFSDSAFPSNGENHPSTNFENCYFFGAQYGELDYHLIFCDSQTEGSGYVASVLDRFTYLMGKEHENPNRLNLRGAMPPKYIFGFFQGIYGFAGLQAPTSETETNQDGPAPIYVDQLVKQYKQANIALEGLAIDVDVQDQSSVFTTNGQFWTGGAVGSGQSVFQWARDQDLVSQTNIMCFIRCDREQGEYPVFDSLVDTKLYTTRQTLDGELSLTDLPQVGNAPEDAYNGLLDYGGGQTALAVFPDLGSAQTREWWGQNYYDKTRIKTPLLEIGLDFIWQDMTIPAMASHVLGNPVEDTSYSEENYNNNTFNWRSYHPQVCMSDPRFGEDSVLLPYIALKNLHPYAECQATYEKGLLANPNPEKMKYQRSYIISRGGYVGLQHYAGIWTGDNGTDWSFLQIMVPMVLNMGLCGLPITGSDIGGFAAWGDDNPASSVMMTRWVQAGCLMPWFRDHYDRVTENKDHGKAYQELYRYPDRYQKIMRDCVNLRVRWHHVLYDGMYQFVQTGLPMLKPTCLYEGGGGRANMAGFEQKQNDQFFICNYDIAVAPALEDEDSGLVENHPVWLPADRMWFIYDARTDGPADMNLQPTTGQFSYLQGQSALYYVDVPIDKLPLFIRDGAIVPTRIAKDISPDKIKYSSKNIQQLDDDDPFVLDIWPGKGNQYRLYLDDGGKTRGAEVSADYAVYLVAHATTFAPYPSPSSWKVDLTWEKGKRSVQHFFYLRLRASNEPASIQSTPSQQFNPVNSYEALVEAQTPGYFYDGTRQELWVKFKCEWMDNRYSIQVNYPMTPYTIQPISTRS